MPARVSAPRIAMPPKRGAGREASAPWKAPIGVRVAESITRSCMNSNILEPAGFCSKPAQRIARIVHRQRLLGESEWKCGIEHHCEFLGTGDVETLECRAGVRAVRDALGMQRERAGLHAAA